MSSFSDKCTNFMTWMTAKLGSIPAVFLAFLLIFVWAVLGPLFKFSDTWQLIINTTTTIVTFLMVFIVQNTQNRDGMAIQAKLDAILGELQDLDDGLVGLEKKSAKDIDAIHKAIIARERNGNTV